MVVDIQDDQLCRIAQLQTPNHAQPEAPDSREHHKVLIPDLRSVNAVLGASIGFYKDGGLHGQILGQLVNDSLFGQAHVFSHAAVDVILETVDIVFLTHPITSGITKFAIPARDYLIGGHAVPNLKIALYIRSQFNNMPDKLMSRDDRGLNVGGAPLLSPETGCAQIGFRITGTDSTGLHFDDDFALSRPRDIHLFNTIILRGMGHQGPHFFRQIHHLVSPPHVTLKDTLLDVKNTQDRYNGRKRVLPPVMKTL